jgi:signal transduction histidine kinase
VIDNDSGTPEVEIAVQDTGIGIDPQDHELVFEKFYQTGDILLHSSGKTKFKGGGPGLGLAIARGIVEAHGGRIWLESPGHNEKTYPGTTFYVRLPMNDQQQ